MSSTPEPLGSEADHDSSSLTLGSPDGADKAASPPETELERVPTIQDTGSHVEYVNAKPVFKPGRDLLLAFGAITVLSFATSIDATTLGVALPTMSAQLGGTALEAFWSGTSFLLASTVLQPTLASLSNIFGRKYPLCIMCIFFAVGSLVSALANNFTIVILGRTIQGIGGSGLIALIEVIVTDLIPLRFRGNYFSIISAVWAVGTVSGPLIGAGFAQNVSWRWIFWINIPIVGVGFAAVVLFLHQSKIPGGVLQKLAGFDWLGSALFTISSTAFLFGITTGGTMYAWNSWRTLLPLIIGPFGLLGFGIWETKFAKSPIIHHGIFRNRDLIITYIMAIFHGAILWTIIYFLILYYQGVLFYSPITSSLATLPETLTVAPAAVVVGAVVAATGHYRWSLWGGWFMSTFGMGILLLLKPDTSVAAWIFLNVPLGLGMGMLFPALSISIQAACEPALNGEAAAFFVFMRTFGQAIGVALGGVIFQNSFKQKLLAIPAFMAIADEYSRDATTVISIIQQMPAGDERGQLVGAYNDALKTIWISLTAYSALNLVLSLLVKGSTLDQEHVTEQKLVEGKASVLVEKKGSTQMPVGPGGEKDTRPRDVENGSA